MTGREVGGVLSYWLTSPDLVDDLVYWLLEPWHGPGTQIRVLEPSAGGGHLIHPIHTHLPQARITALEPSPLRAALLRTQPGIEVVESTLEEYLASVTARALTGEWEPFHLVVTNPPFTPPGRCEVWAEHILALYCDPYLLAPCGTLGAVVPRVVMTGESPRVRAVRDLIGECGGVEECDPGAFSARGAQVSTVRIWAQKPFDARADYHQARCRVRYLVGVGVLPLPDTVPCTECGHLWRPGQAPHNYDHHLGYGVEYHGAVEAVCAPCHRNREAQRRRTA